MRFSFIVPAYNVEKYLQRCIGSILRQSNNDYEIIIVDDESTDGTGVLADKIYLSRPDIIRVIHQQNKGLGGARNTGIENAAGEYLVFLDSDDYIREDMLDIAQKYIDENDLDVFVFGFQPIDDKNIGNEPQKIDYDDFKMINQKDYLIICGASAWNKIVRKNILFHKEIRFPEKTLYEDIATTPMYAIHATNIGVVSTKLYYYVQRPGSIISVPKLERVFELHCGYDRVLAYYKEKRVFEKYHDELEFLAIVHALFHTDVRIFLTYGGKKYLDKSREYIEKNFPDHENNIYLSEKYLLEKNGVDYKLFSMILKKKYLLAKMRYFSFLKLRRIIKSYFLS